MQGCMQQIKHCVESLFGEPIGITAWKYSMDSTKDTPIKTPNKFQATTNLNQVLICRPHQEIFFGELVWKALKRRQCKSRLYQWKLSKWGTPCIKVINIGSDAFRKPIFQKVLKNYKYPGMLFLALPARRKVLKLHFQSDCQKLFKSF